MPFEVPEGWVWVEIAEIASSISYGVSESAKTSGKYRLLRITDIQNGKVSWESVPFTDYPEEKAKSFELSNGDILFARTGATVGKSYLVESVPSNAIYASYLIRIQYSYSISSRYLKYFFESGYYWEQISSSSVGVGQPNVNGSSLGKLKIPLPPVAEQKRITTEAQKWVNIIDELEYESKHLGDDIDAAKLKILDLAIHGKLAPQAPSDVPAIELLKGINPAFKASDNLHYEGDIPKKWTICTLADVTNYGNCVSVPISEIGDEDWVLELEDIEKGTGRVIQRMSKKSRILNGIRYRFYKGQVLYSKLRTYLNKVFVADDNGFCTTEIIPITTSECILPEYLNIILRSPYFKDYSARCGYGVKMPRLGTNDAKKALIPLPPLPEQVRIIRAVDEWSLSLDKVRNLL